MLKKTLFGILFLNKLNQNNLFFKENKEIDEEPYLESFYFDTFFHKSIYNIDGDISFRNYNNFIKSSILLINKDNNNCYFEIYEKLKNKENSTLYHIQPKKFPKFNAFLINNYTIYDPSFLEKILPKYMLENNEQKINFSQIPKDFIDILETKSDDNLLYNNICGLNLKM